MVGRDSSFASPPDAGKDMPVPAPLINNSIYPKNHIIQSKIVEKANLKTTKISVSRQRRPGAGNRKKRERKI